MKALVTGGTGFTGHALVRRLLAEGWDVAALDNKHGLKDDELTRAGARLLIGSVTDADLVRRATEGADVVFHLAAAFREYDAPDAHYDAVNVGGTRNVLRAAEEAGARKVVYCSTCGVHGDVADPPAGEDAPIQPADHYQLSKYEGEKVVAEFARRGMDTVTLRPAALYGPGDPERFVMLFRRVARGRFPMFGSGRTYYHPLYIDNMVDAFLLAARPGVGSGQAYLIADDEYLEIETLVRKVSEAMGVRIRIDHLPLWPLEVAAHVCEAACRPLKVRPPIFPRRVHWFSQNRAFRIDKARRDLGYRPRVGIDEGLRRTGEWYRRQGLI
ncbi:MAG TPA: NAD-dependent epimerase/dehydratase family protein [Azospirillum sp.]|nr:NAD-dependent epimerase/dehydratase family protein [Azospirillum sp.]